MPWQKNDGRTDFPAYKAYVPSYRGIVRVDMIGSTVPASFSVVNGVQPDSGVNRLESTSPAVVVVVVVPTDECTGDRTNRPADKAADQCTLDRSAVVMVVMAAVHHRPHHRSLCEAVVVNTAVHHGRRAHHRRCVDSGLRVDDRRRRGVDGGLVDGGGLVVNCVHSMMCVVSKRRFRITIWQHKPPPTWTELEADSLRTGSQNGASCQKRSFFGGFRFSKAERD